MTKGDLIYDWRKSEGSFRYKLVAFVIVAVIFTVFWGSLQIRSAAARNDRSGSASILRFRGDDLGRFWLLQAEEHGPFPGRLEFDGHDRSLSPEWIDGAEAWNNYRSRMRPIGDDEGYSREDLASKGVRVFPSRTKPGVGPGLTPPVPKKIRQKPVLIPYDRQALAWMPDVLPDYVIAEGAGTDPAAWRFAINLGEDGAVRDSISLGSGDDAGQAAMEVWLRGVRFKPAEGDRWLGLRVEFVNQPDNGTEPE